MQLNDINKGTVRIASGLDDVGYLAKIKGWREPTESKMDDNIGFWTEGSQCDKAKWGHNILQFNK